MINQYEDLCASLAQMNGGKLLQAAANVSDGSGADTLHIAVGTYTRMGAFLMVQLLLNCSAPDDDTAMNALFDQTREALGVRADSREMVIALARQVLQDPALEKIHL